MSGQTSRTRRGLATGILAALIATGAAPALGALPSGGASFSGNGSVYYNNAPHWQRAQSAQISFGISPNRRRIINFYGSYTFYCGAGRAYVKAHFITITKKGAFRYDFSVPNRSASGQVYGRAYVSIYGHFLHGGKRADVNYLVDYLEPGQKSMIGKHQRVRHPYSPRKPQALGCASWVRGVARAR